MTIPGDNPSDRDACITLARAAVVQPGTCGADLLAFVVVLPETTTSHLVARVHVGPRRSMRMALIGSLVLLGEAIAQTDVRAGPGAAWLVIDWGETVSTLQFTTVSPLGITPVRALTRGVPS